MQTERKLATKEIKRKLKLKKKIKWEAKIKNEN